MIPSKKSRLEVPLLLSVIIAGFLLRFYGLNWDQGYHLHPDERAIVMISERIHWPAPGLPAQAGEWSKILTPESPLNPKFFAYGSFPLYLLKFGGFLGSFFDKSWTSYDKINLIGRAVSALFDVGTILIIYLITKRLFDGNRTTALLSVFFYATAVLPIQLSHFYAVDTLLNFFIWLTIFLLISYLTKPSGRLLFLSGVTTALALSTKFTGIFLLVPALASLLISYNQEKAKFTTNLKRLVLRFSFYFLIFALSTFIFMPYAFIDFPTFKSNLIEQLRMSKDTFVFPFTLQYVGTKPYLYPLQQIFLWGLGPVISLFSFAGLLLFLKGLPLRLRKGRPYGNAWLILLVFNLVYFLLMGQSAVKFMRYYLPLYPFLAILAAFVVSHALERAKLVVPVVIVTALVWPLSFIQIYAQPNTRLTASAWIYENVPPRSIIAVETWDDGIPIGLPINYQTVELPMNEFETNPNKWPTIEETLSSADYLIISSNRNYRPLRKLTNCEQLPAERCYTKTSEFYRQLFDNELEFKKVSEFTSYPALSIFPFSINDDGADESFTVYDHPKVMIFKKT